jgi:hypothetical protein
VVGSCDNGNIYSISIHGWEFMNGLGDWELLCKKHSLHSYLYHKVAAMEILLFHEVPEIK